MSDLLHFDPTVGLGSLLTGIITVAGFLITIAVWKTKTDSNVQKISDLEKKIAVIDTQIEESRIHITENYVRKGDIDKLEGRIERMFTALNDNLGGKLKDVEHHMRNLDAKIYSVATRTIKDL